MDPAVLSALSALGGAIVGGLASLAGTVYGAKQQRKKDERQQTEKVRAASRAWRDDFWTYQETLVEVIRTGSWPEAAEVPLLGNTENLMTPAAAMQGDEDWTTISSARRKVHAAQEQRKSNPRPDRDEAVKLFCKIDEAREALASTDDTWCYKPHKGAEVVARHLAEQEGAD